jgi:hypothetical protein
MIKPQWRVALSGVVLTLVFAVQLQAAAQTPVSPSPEASASASASADAVQAAAAPASAAHRSLRLPLPDMGALPQPTVPEVFKGYPAAPPHRVVSRKAELPLYPCNMCHNLQKLNTTVRQFKVAPPPEGAPHAGVLRHGKGQMWCLDCHNPKDRQYLRTVTGETLDFDDSPRLCGQCHSARYRDWAFGAHGKRATGWAAEREIYACTHCHNPHAPLIPMRQASAPPPVRSGLLPMTSVKHRSPPLWLQAQEGHALETRTRP